jgi:hypothetical protein
MNEVCLLSDLNRYVGVAVAFIGSVVVAPSGAILLWRSVTDWLRQHKHELRGRLARFLSFLRRRRGGPGILGSSFSAPPRRND